MRVRWTVDAESGCWNWTGPLDHGGYPNEHAHRLVYVHHGGTIPEGFHLHHQCHNKTCVNPAHLEPLEPREHERLHWRQKTKLTPEQLEEIKRLAKTDMTAEEIAAWVNVNKWSVHRIINGSRWDEPGDDLKPDRSCAHCGGSIVGRRRQARFCSKVCQIASSNIKRYRRMHPNAKHRATTNVPIHLREQDQS